MILQYLTVLFEVFALPKAIILGPLFDHFFDPIFGPPLDEPFGPPWPPKVPTLPPHVDFGPFLGPPWGPKWGLGAPSGGQVRRIDEAGLAILARGPPPEGLKDRGLDSGDPTRRWAVRFVFVALSGLNWSSLLRGLVFAIRAYLQYPR